MGYHWLFMEGRREEAGVLVGKRGDPSIFSECVELSSHARAHSEPDEPQARWAIRGRMLRSQWEANTCRPPFSRRWPLTEAQQI